MTIQGPGSVDVCVIGAGPLGLLTGVLLATSGVRVTVIDPAPRAARAWLGVAWPSPNDPPTRALVAHGEEVAQWLTRAHRDGLASLASPPIAPLFQCEAAPAFRYGLEAFEREELFKAVRAARGDDGTGPGLGLKEVARPIGLQEPGVLFAETALALVEIEPGSWRDRAIAALLSAGGTLLEAKVEALEETTAGVTLTVTVRGRQQKMKAEIAVLAASWSIAALMPSYADVLVPVSDACFLWPRAGHVDAANRAAGENGAATAKETASDRSPIVLRGNSGHVAVAWLPGSPEPLRVAGPRFLWPDAGVGLAREGKVEEPLLKRAVAFHESKTLALLARTRGVASFQEFAQQEGMGAPVGRFGVDCLPCDELPVAGELGRWGRVLGAAGFLGTGMSAHALMARALAETAWGGRSDRLHPRLSPRRLDTR